MPSTFDDAFAVVKSLAKDYEANKGHYGLTEDEIKIVEGAAK